MFVLRCSNPTSVALSPNDVFSLTAGMQLSKSYGRVEEYHRGIKQFVGIELAQVRSNQEQRNHIVSGQDRIGLKLKLKLSGRLSVHTYLILDLCRRSFL